jgi:SAM-dependent methyltransferase
MAARPVPSWLDSPVVQAEVNRRATGDPRVGWTEYVTAKYLVRDGRGCHRGLSLGCGAGALERQLRALGACDEIDALDISPAALAEARRRAAEAGVTGVRYEERDLNRLTLPAAVYDAVFAAMSAHHVTGLENLYAQVRRALRPGGVFVLWEFVGPTLFRFTPKAVRVINDVLALLPDRLRREAACPGRLRTEIVVPTLELMAEVDPSEAIRSSEIIPLLDREFDVLERRDWGGTVAHLLLNEIAHNFDPASPEDTALLKLILYLEDVLIREGVLESDFTLIVAAPRATGGG